MSIPLIFAAFLALAPLGPVDASQPSAQANRLVGETSPYLLLHAYNPVDWYPWGPEALDRARREDKPIFLSVGYSTCYWCHVMERQVFSDTAIAAQMNKLFVNIKVDREERPDLDRIYMTATQLIARHGGWPNSVFLTPDLQPFYAGTYFPPQDRYGRPGFPSVLETIHQAWTQQRDEVNQIGARVTKTIQELESGAQTEPMAPDSVMVNRALNAIKGRYDGVNGGFGGAPKFPPSMRLDLLLDAWVESMDEKALDIVLHTLEAMALGGIYDQVGGGFHRYATEAEWKVPHFEKMLYNQAQLTHLYLRAYQVTGERMWRQVATDILTFVAREMTAESGGFYSALDAETEAVEGKYYLWDEDQIEQVLGAEAESFFEVYDLAPMPEEEGGVVYMRQPLEAAAAELETDLDQLATRVKGWRQQLLAARQPRTYPLLDDKILTAWNGLMIGATAEAFAVLADSTYYRLAAGAADFVLEHMQTPDGSLQRLYRNGKTKRSAYLEDYAYLIQGLLALHRASDEKRWLDSARQLTQVMQARFGDEAGGFFLTEGGDDLLVRSKNALDSALPSANAAAVHALLDLAQHTGEAAYHQEAAKALYAFGGAMRASPSGFVYLIAATGRYLATDWTKGSALPVALPQLDQTGLPIPPKVLSARIAPSTLRPQPGHPLQFEVHLALEPGWHINANPAKNDFLIPTTLTLNADLPLEVLAIEYPAATALYQPASDETLTVYQGQVTIRAETRLESEARPGQRGEARLLLQYQACDEARCLPPAEHLERINLEVGSLESN